MALGNRAGDVVLVVRLVTRERRNRTRDLVEQGADLEPSSTSLVVSSDATIRPVSASTPMWILRRDRRTLVPCFSISHSPGPQSFSPVLSISRCTGLASLSLYLPEVWANDPARRGAAGVPETTVFATKPQLGRQMLARAFAAGVRAAG